jgi:hypothetical protein
VCSILLKLLCPAEVGTIEQPRQNRDSKPIVLWLPSGQSAQQEADHKLWEVGDRHVSDPLAWESPEHASVLSNDVVVSAVSDPMTPLPALLAALLSARWLLYQAVVPQGGNDAHQSKYHCLCLLSRCDQQLQSLLVLPLPLFSFFSW